MNKNNNIPKNNTNKESTSDFNIIENIKTKISEILNSANNINQQRELFHKMFKEIFKTETLAFSWIKIWKIKDLYENEIEWRNNLEEKTQEKLKELLWKNKVKDFDFKNNFTELKIFFEEFFKIFEENKNIEKTKNIKNITFPGIQSNNIFDIENNNIIFKEKCPDQYIWDLKFDWTEFTFNYFAWTQRKNINEINKENKTIAIVLESPHKDEFWLDENKKVHSRPANGTTWDNIRDFFANNLNNKLSELQNIWLKSWNYNVIIVNSSQYQTSLWEDTSLYRTYNFIEQIINPENQTDFQHRLNKADYVINCCTKWDYYQIIWEENKINLLNESWIKTVKKLACSNKYINNILNELENKYSSNNSILKSITEIKEKKIKRLKEIVWYFIKKNKKFNWKIIEMSHPSSKHFMKEEKQKKTTKY